MSSHSRHPDHPTHTAQGSSIMVFPFWVWEKERCGGRVQKFEGGKRISNLKVRPRLSLPALGHSLFMFAE